MPVIVLIIALKFVLPVLYLRFPFAAGWANLLLDSADGDILVRAGLADPTYQLIDKLADYVAYVFMFLWGRKREIRRDLAATLLLRTVGQVLFFATRDERVFFLFPNLIEPLFLVYVTIGRLAGWDRVHDIYRRRVVPIWAFILAYKLQDEWFTHIADVDRSDLLMRILGR